MSRFGDGTPHEDLLNAVENVQDDYGLTDRELVIVLLAVLQLKNDPIDENNELRERKREEGIK